MFKKYWQHGILTFTTPDTSASQIFDSDNGCSMAPELKGTMDLTEKNCRKVVKEAGFTTSYLGRFAR